MDNNFPSFGQRSEVFFGPRASGRTYWLLKNAPEGVTILAKDKQHAYYLMAERDKIGRSDLKVKVLTTPSVGDYAPYWPDHWTITGLFYQADMVIAERDRVIRKHVARIKELENEQDRQSAHIEDCEAWIKWVDEQPEGEILRLRANNAENQAFDQAE